LKPGQTANYPDLHSLIEIVFRFSAEGAAHAP
jgi:hypothetical protein